MTKIIGWVILVCLMLMPGEILAGDSVTVHITVEGFKGENGICRLLLFESEKGFPDSREYALLMLNQYIQGSAVEFSFKLLPGTYAISILHDQNANGKMDKTWFGKPTEGIGASNNPGIGFGPPGFKESAVLIDSSKNNYKIKLKYL